MKIGSRNLTIGTFVASVLGVLSNAHAGAAASATGSPESAAGNDVAVLPDVVVTARRREENLQSVPISVTVLNPQVLRDNNVTALGDIQTLVPSLAVTSANVGQRDSANVSIRGQGYGSIAGQPAVAMYINEVPIPTDYDGALAGGPGLFFDLEDVQVLKGPQGTLFGRNTMGGAVLLQTARPKNELGGHLEVGFGNYGDRQTQGAVNLPIVDTVLLARIAFSAETRDGYSFVQGLPHHPEGLDLDNRDFWAVRGTLSFNPVDSFRNDLVLTQQKYKSHGTADFIAALDPAGPVVATYPNALALLAEQQALGARQHLPLDIDTNGTNGSLLALQNITRVGVIPGIVFRNIVGFQKAVFDYRASVPGLPLPVFDVAPDRYPANQVSEEAQLQGKSFGDRLDWVAGVFYADQRPPDRDYVSTVGVSILQPEGTPPGQPNLILRRQLLLKTDAAFSQATWQLADRWKVTGGLRYTWDHRDDGSLVNDAIVRRPSVSRALTYTTGIDFQITPDTLSYVTSRRGYRAGGATTSINALVFPFAPEYVTDYELGLKSTWSVWGIRLRTNTAVYYQRYTDIQVNQLIPYPGVPGGVNITTNAGKAHLWGGEFEGTAAFTDSLQAGLTYSKLGFAYEAFAPGVDGAALEAGRTANRIPQAVSANVVYTLPLPDSVGRVAVRADYHWQDRFGDFLGTSQIPSYGIANLSVDWHGIARAPFDAQVFVTNVTDKTYQDGGIGFLGFTERTYGAPRMYGLRLNYRFGGDDR